jgi:hypothetical protein
MRWKKKMMVTSGVSMTIPSGAVLRKNSAPPPAKQHKQSRGFIKRLWAIAFSSDVVACAASFAGLFVMNPIAPTPKYQAAKIIRTADQATFRITKRPSFA